MKTKLQCLALSTIFFITSAAFPTENKAPYEKLHLNESLYDTRTGIERVEQLVDFYREGAFHTEVLYKEFQDDEFYSFVEKHQNQQEEEVTSLSSFERAKKRLKVQSEKFFTYAPCGRVTKYLDELCNIHFTESEKETLYYFDYLKEKKDGEHETPLESKIACLLHETEYLKEIKSRANKHKLSSFDSSDLDIDFLISFYTLQHMVKLFDENEFDPVLFQHVETYGKTLKKQFVLSHNFLVLEKFSKGKIEALSDLDLLARSILKPYMKKFSNS